LAQRRRDAATVSLDGEDGEGAWLIPVAATQSQRVELQEVLLLMGRLPAEQREVLLLAAVEELRYEEIAAVLAVPVGTVMSRLSRARDKLKRFVAEAPPALRIVK
jgi:RNA polymerase sigma-70 factor (ECF subfamily)